MVRLDPHVYTRRRLGLLLIVAAIAAIATAPALLTAPGAGARAEARDFPRVVCWATRVVDDVAQPTWKRAIARGLLARVDRLPQQIAFSSTWYAEQDELDPTGGGFWTASGLHVAYGLVGTDNKHWPLGTVFYCDELDRALIVADNGPGVRGPRALDVWVPDARTRDALCRKWRGNDGRGVLHLRRLGRIDLKQLK